MRILNNNNNSKNNNKAILYSLDAALGLLFTIIIMTTIIGYFERSVYNRQASMQMFDLGSDALAVLQIKSGLQNYYTENEWFFNGSVYDVLALVPSPLNGSGIKLSPKYPDNFYDYSLKLNGSPSFVNLQTEGTRDFFGTYPGGSISVWIKHYNNGSNLTIFEDSWSNYTSRMSLSLNGTNYVVFKVSSNNTQTNRSLVSGEAIEFGVWHHIVAMVNISMDRLTIYIDTVKYNSTVSPSFYALTFTSSSQMTTRFGASSANTSTFIGYIDSIDMFSRELGFAEVTNLYENLSVSSNLISRYTFNAESTQLNNSLNEFIPQQFTPVVELIDIQNRTLANLDIVSPASDVNYISTSERIVAVKNNTGEIGQILLARLHLMVK